MTEILSTRANPLVDPAFHVWGPEIPIYLFLGGWVAGMMVLSGLFLRRGRPGGRRSVCCRLPLYGLTLLTGGMLALFLDLEHKLYVWRLYVTWQPLSPMSWGAWILVLVYPALLATALVDPPGMLVTRVPAVAAVSTWLARPGPMCFLAWTNLSLGMALGVYTGILLSALGARPLWSSALLGPLFLASGLSAAAAFAHLVAPDREESRTMARADNAFLTIELGLIALLVIGLATAGESQRAAAALVLGGPYTAVFWVLVVGLGIAVPLLIQGLAVSHRIAHTPLAPVLVLLGGLALRFVIVSAGQASHWVRTSSLAGGG